MGEIFFIADTHFGQKSILSFKNGGHPLRPFKSLTEMHVTMVENWNRVVSPGDKVYHLGDVAFSKEGLHLLAMLNGKKRLVRGNHDLLKLAQYREYFSEIYGVRQIDGYWLTHVPIHPQSAEGGRFMGNIHGHLHCNDIPDPRYLNVCVERINYTPISFDEARAALSISAPVESDDA